MNAGLFDLTGKNALVTGGAQGLGRMIAEGLLRAGATVAITSRKADICEAAASEMAALGKCIALPADLADPGTPEALARRTQLETAKWAKAIKDAKIEPQ